VLALPELYRRVLLLRYFEDLGPKAIAAEERVPLDTVKARLRGAHAKLVERLDAAHGGDGRGWLMAISPLAGVRPGETARLTSGVAHLLLDGAALLAVAATATWGIQRLGTEPRETIAAEPDAGETPMADELAAVEADAAEPERIASTSPTTAPEPDDSASVQWPATLRVQVLGPASGESVAGAAVTLVDAMRLRSGAVRLGVEADEGAVAPRVIHEPTQPVELRVEALAMVTLTFKDADRLIPHLYACVLVPEGRPVGEAIHGDEQTDGEVHWDQIPTGTYTLRIGIPGVLDDPLRLRGVVVTTDGCDGPRLTGLDPVLRYSEHELRLRYESGEAAEGVLVHVEESENLWAALYSDERGIARSPVDGSPRRVRISRLGDEAPPILLGRSRTNTLAAPTRCPRPAAVRERPGLRVVSDRTLVTPSARGREPLAACGSRRGRGRPPPAARPG